MKNEKTERTKKRSFKTLIAAALCLCFALALGIAGAGFTKISAKADGETVEVMNDHFTALVDANGYRSDFVTDQMIRLQYDKQFHKTDAWLNDKASSNYTIDGMDLGNYLVINGMTFNEIRTKYSGLYASVDNRTNLSKGGDWSPVTVRAYPDYIYIAVHRSFTDIGSMTVGLKDGFSYVYNGTTYKTEGDLIFKATLDPSSNFETPIFVKQEEASETEYEFNAIKRNLEALADKGAYKGFRIFPSFYGDTFASYSTRWLGDHYLYMKDYILINDKPVNYWNIEKYSADDDYTTNPIGNSGRVYATPVIVQFYNNGEYQIWIHSAWAERNGLDFNNIKFSIDKGMPFVQGGKVYVAGNKYSTDTINGTTYYTKYENEVVPNVSIENATEQTALNHLVVDVTLSEAMDDIVWHMIDGYAANAEALTKILINGKSVAEINSTTDITGWDWSGGCGFSATNALLQKPVLILCNAGKMTIYINGQYRNTLENGRNTDVKIEIKGGANVLYQPSRTEAGNKYMLAAMEETAVYNRTYKLSVYPNGAEGEAIETEVAHGNAIETGSYDKAGYTLVWTDGEGNAALTVMPENDYAIYAKYTVIEYSANVGYLDGTSETVKYTIENRAEKLAEISVKFTAKTAEYEYVLDKTELPLENCTVNEVKKPVEYTVTLKFADGATETIKFNVETRSEVLEDLNKKLTESTDEYEYFWKGGLPEELPLENIVLEVERKAKEYTLMIDYAEKDDETVKFTVETRAEALNSLAEKLTPAANGYTYSWKNLPEVLELKNQTITEEKTAIKYTLTVVYADETKENEEIEFTVETKDGVYASLANKISANTKEYSYAWDKTELTLEDVTVTEIKTAVEYTLTIVYTDESKQNDEIKFTVLNKDEVFNSLADKLTADSAAYVYGWDKSELNLENTTINETKEAVEYTLTIKYADKAEEKLTFTVENKAAVLASLTGKLTPSTDEYEYSWKDLPTELELKNVTVTEVKTVVGKPNESAGGSESGETSEDSGDESRETSGCFGSVSGFAGLAAAMLMAGAIVIAKKKKD